MDLIVNNFHQLFSLLFSLISSEDLSSAALNLVPTSLPGVYTFQILRNTHAMFTVCTFNFCTLSFWVTLLCSSQQSCLCFLIPIHLGNLLTILFRSGNPPFGWGLMERPVQKYAKWISGRILSQASHDVIKQYKMGLSERGFCFRGAEFGTCKQVHSPTPHHPLWVWAKFCMPGCERRTTATDNTLALASSTEGSEIRVERTVTLSLLLDWWRWRDLQIIAFPRQCSQREDYSKH